MPPYNNVVKNSKGEWFYNGRHKSVNAAASILQGKNTKKKEKKNL